ncbi:uncharacterized protein LOC108164842 [Drosophila miranda]|uniref:uncharacterized protein LOC108164842 n=1 Tax=Drosophila miranda TaxID=7229 RepID=UPI0007E64BD3|nr:uncharacterized protein LOC108164842 [Drosophila miranda]
MNSNWREEYIRKSVGYYVSSKSSPEDNSTPNVQAVEDKPYFASNIAHYPHLQPTNLTWVPDHLSYADLKEAVDKGFDPKQLRPKNIPWSKLKSESNTLFDWPKYTRTGGQYAHGNANANAMQKKKQENLRPPNGRF